MKQKFLSFVLAALLIISAQPAPALAADTNAYAALEGSGTEADPYRIGSLSELEMFRDMVNSGEAGAGGFFRLIADINMKLGYGAGKGADGEDLSWTPIGIGGHSFSGTFDGGGHTITGLYIHVEQGSQALFGSIDKSGKVKNISVEGSVTSVSGLLIHDYTAGVAAINYGTVENCHSNVDVSGRAYVGGVIGANQGTVKNCSNRGAVIGTNNYVGGVVGESIGGTVESCCNIGPVSGANAVGGVAGRNYSNGKVKNCFNTGAVTGTKSYVGGIVGLNEKGTMGEPVSVENCFNIGTVTGSGSYIGGAAGYNSGSVTNCYYLDTCGASGANGVSKTAEEFKTLAALLGNPPFEDSEFLGHPILTSNFQGYPIPDLAALERFRDFVNAGKFDAGETFFLTADIDMSAKYGAGKGAGGADLSWTPIGTADHPFVGTFDGGGHQITGLYLHDTADFASAKGLFGTAGQEDQEAAVQNLGVSGSVTSVASFGGVGGIVGRLTKGGVQFCHYSGSVTSGEGDIGGLVGSIGRGSVTHCYNTGAVTGTGGSIGGIAGFIDSGSAESCYNIGTITATGGGDGVGPVVGGDLYVHAGNCYYLDTCGASGAGESKTDAEFASGEVAHLLQRDWGGLVWGQTLTGDSKENFPVLTDDISKAVFLATFQNGDETVLKAYCNFNDTVSLPTPDPVKTGYAFAGWYTQTGTDGEPFTAASAVQGDVTLYAQWKHAVPDAPTINYTAETLSTTAAMEYSADGANWKACTADMPAAGLGWSGVEKTVRLRTAATAGYHASDAVSVTIPTRPGAPTGLQGINETSAGKNDGKLTGVSTAMEYKLSAASSWTPCGGTEVTGLAPGSYQVRVKAVTAAGSEAFASAAAAVTIQKGAPTSPSSPPAVDEPKPCPQDETCPIAGFTDAAPTAWYHDGVHYCLENGLMSGFGRGKLGPNDKLTRAQLIQILYNKEGHPSVSPDSGFTDVAEDMWYAKAISWAAQNHIAAGYGSGRFGPNDPITREQLATILWQYGGSPEVSGSLDRFTDGNKTSTWAVPAMQWAVAEGVMNGNGDGTLTPTGKAARAEAAAMIKNYCERE